MTTNAERQRAWRDKHRKQKEPIECGTCGKEFMPARSTAQYCSSTCRSAARKVRNDKALVAVAAKRAEQVALFNVKWRELDKLTVAELVTQLAEHAAPAFMKYPFLTRDGYWLTDARIVVMKNHYIHRTKGDDELRSIHVTIEDSYPLATHSNSDEHGVVNWTVGPGCVPRQVGDPRIMVQVLMEVISAPEIAYERARQWIIEHGGKLQQDHSTEAGLTIPNQPAHIYSGIHGARYEGGIPPRPLHQGQQDIRAAPMPWEYRHMPWRPLDMDDDTYYALVAEQNRVDRRQQLTREAEAAAYGAYEDGIKRLLGK